MKISRQHVMIAVVVLSVIVILGSLGCASWMPMMQSEGFHGQSNKPSFVLFYMPKCPHCKKMMNDYDNLMKRYRGVPEVNVIKISSDEYPDLMKKYNVQSFPTMRWYPEGMDNMENFEEYNGDRTENAMQSYLEGVTAPAPDFAAPLDQSEPPSSPSGFPMKALSEVSDIMNMN